MYKNPFWFRWYRRRRPVHLAVIVLLLVTALILDSVLLPVAFHLPGVSQTTNGCNEVNVDPRGMVMMSLGLVSGMLLM